MPPRFSDLAIAAFAATLLASPAAHAKQKESVFYSFGVTSADASFPQDGLIADKAGNMYGTAYGGGLNGEGAVFIVGANGLETVIYSFTGGANDGAQPNAGLVMDKKGNLFGTTLAGGPANRGVVFELVPNGQSYTEKVLYSFCAQAGCADGASLTGRVTLGAKGVLYGTTQVGGSAPGDSHINGVVWRLDPPKKHQTAWTETVLYNFCSQANCTDGRGPYSAPLLAADGFLYGTAAFSQTGGTLYRLSPNGGGYQVLHTFGNTTADGATPISALAADKDGVLYGTTRQGGGSNGCGTVYSFNPATFVYTQLYAFCSQPNDARASYAGVTIIENAKSKVLYGNSLLGGANDLGTIYSLTAPQQAGDPWTEKVLYSFCPQSGCADGAEPGFGSPLRIGGAFYGTAMGGGAFNSGVVYRFGAPQ